MPNRCTLSGERNRHGQFALELLDNGNRWSQVVVHSRQSWLNGISCMGRMCVSVGVSSPNALIVANARRSTIFAVKHAISVALNAIACPRTNECYAAGEEYMPLSSSRAEEEPLILRWKEGRWNSEKLPKFVHGQVALAAVGCGSPAFCVVAGTYTPHGSPGGRAVALQLHNGRWTKVGLPHLPSPDANLDGVSCIGRMCVIVGGSRGALEISNRTGAWSAHIMGRGMLRDVSCVTAGNCVAVGTDLSGSFFVKLK